MDKSLEWILTNTVKAELIAWLDAHPEAFEETLKLSLTNNQPYAWRASWLLWSCMKENDPRVQPYVAGIAGSLSVRNDEHQREFLIILRKMEIPEESEGLLFDVCTRVWEKTGNKPALRLNAFKMLVKIAAKHPELQQEMKFLTQPHYTGSLSPAAIKSISRLLKKCMTENAR